MWPAWRSIAEASEVGGTEVIDFGRAGQHLTKKQAHQATDQRISAGERVGNQLTKLREAEVFSFCAFR
jgi:hypothetical protein